MTQALPSTLKAKEKLWTAIGGPIDFRAVLTKDTRELFWVFAGKFALMGSNAVVMLFLAKWLDLKTYGLFVLTISGQLLISRVLMMGVDSAMVRLTMIPELRSRSQEVVRAGLVFMTYTSGALVVVLLAGIPVFSHFAIPFWVPACVVAGAIGSALVDYGYSYRLARQEFPFATLAQGGTAVARVALTAFTALQLPGYSLTVFGAYHGASFMSGLVQSLLIVRASQRPERGLVKRLLGYSSWMGQANVLVIFSLYQGTFLLMLLSNPEETGRFGLALSLSLGFFAIYNAYSEYLSVRVRALEHLRDLPRFIRRALVVALILMLGCVPVIFVMAMLIPWFLGPGWLEEVPILVYLSAAMAVTILRAPLVAACHYLLKPKLITFEWGTQAIVVALAGVILAPEMGAVGAAIAQLLGSTLVFAILSYLVFAAWRDAAKAEG